MSDVYVAFVRDDQPFAEALAVALQGSGFTVSRSASVVDAIGECAAIVVLWTPAAARSKLFVDAADRAFRSGKMVLARMGSDPLPPTFAGTEAHALSRWTGDPESQDIDSIVFHVDRLVSRARMTGGGRPVPEQPEASPPPRGVVHRFPSGGAATARARPAEQPQPTMARAAAPADPLAEEASFWRQIQHSNNPGDFYAYLERFGRGGTFAELAESRISALGARSAPAPHQPASYQPQQQPPPYQPSYQPQQPPMQQHGPGPVARGGFNMQPPQARPAPRPAPQPPRLDPHPARARVEPPSAAPPRESGGGMRGIAFLIFLAVVGGGGFYVYQQFRGPPPEQTAAPLDDWLPPAASTNPADDGVAPESLSASNAVAASPGPAPARRDPPPQRQPQAASPPPVDDGPTPAPTLRTIPAATPAPAPQRAPATVGDPEAASALLRDVPLTPTTSPAVIAPVTPPPAAPAVRPPSRPRWAQRASARDLAAAYPEAAARRGVEGRVVLDCLIGADLAIRCRATTETPDGYGFAAAALRVAQKYRAAPTLEDGRPAAGERTTIAINFRPAA